MKVDKIASKDENESEGLDDIVAALALIKVLMSQNEKYKLLASLVTIKQVILAGDEYIDAAGLNPWCINEGLAKPDDLISIR